MLQLRECPMIGDCRVELVRTAAKRRMQSGYQTVQTVKRAARGIAPRLPDGANGEKGRGAPRAAVPCPTVQTVRTMSHGMAGPCLTVQSVKRPRCRHCLTWHLQRVVH